MRPARCRSPSSSTAGRRAASPTAGPTAGTRECSSRRAMPRSAVDFHGSTGYGQAFTDAIHQNWGGWPLEDLQKGLAFATAQRPAARRQPRLRARRLLRRLHDELDRGPLARPVQMHRPARRRVRRPRHGLRDRGAVVRRMGARRPSLLRGAGRVREMEPGQLRTELEDAAAGDHQRERLPHPLHAGHRGVHRAAAPQHPVAAAGLPRREPLGAEAEELGPMV